MGAAQLHTKCSPRFVFLPFWPSLPRSVLLASPRTSDGAPPDPSGDGGAPRSLNLPSLPKPHGGTTTSVSTPTLLTSACSGVTPDPSRERSVSTSRKELTLTPGMITTCAPTTGPPT